MSKSILFDNTIPVNKTTVMAGKTVEYLLKALETDYIVKNFNNTFGHLLRLDTTHVYDNTLVCALQHYPAHNLQELYSVIQKDFLKHALDTEEFQNLPVLAQYKFPDSVQKHFNLFVLGGDEHKMYVIFEDYEEDTICLKTIKQLPVFNNTHLEKVENTHVKKVRNIWNYHRSAYTRYIHLGE